MSIITIILFFIYTYGLGYSISFFLKSSNNLFERNLMRIGFGLGVIPLLGVILNLLHIPIDWKIFLVLSIIIPVYNMFRFRNSIKIPSIKLTKSNIAVILVLVMFFLTLFMYVKGSFVYPYLEDDDPWTHAKGIKYVTMEKNVRDTNCCSFWSIASNIIISYVDHEVFQCIDHFLRCALFLFLC